MWVLVWFCDKKVLNHDAGRWLRSKARNIQSILTQLFPLFGNFPGNDVCCACVCVWCSSTIPGTSVDCTFCRGLFSDCPAQRTAAPSPSLPPPFEEQGHDPSLRVVPLPLPPGLPSSHSLALAKHNGSKTHDIPKHPSPATPILAPLGCD